MKQSEVVRIVTEHYCKCVRAEHYFLRKNRYHDATGAAVASASIRALAVDMGIAEKELSASANEYMDSKGKEQRMKRYDVETTE